MVSSFYWLTGTYEAGKSLDWRSLIFFEKKLNKNLIRVDGRPIRLFYGSFWENIFLRFSISSWQLVFFLVPK
ncbi:MAG: hypothetical protein A1D16_14875 [Flavihumibacter sp. CACIAM 22H1]|nr:MAG: hypothetical protein A1D16_14875 [Flavihumibacter sp. CACIAM 22H1]